MQAPDFRLRDQNGTAVSLEEFRGKKVVLYFYPKAETPGCTVEACAFRDNITAFKELGAVVLGISPDDPDDLKGFERNHDLNFPLLSDPTHETAEKYGVWKEKSFMGRRFMGVARTSFLIDERGEIVKRYDNVNPVSHTAEVLADLGAKPGRPVVRTGRQPTATKKAAKKKTARKSPAKAKKNARKTTSKRPAHKRAARKTSRSPAATSRASSAKKRPARKARNSRAKTAMRGRR